MERRAARVVGHAWNNCHGADAGRSRLLSRRGRILASRTVSWEDLVCFTDRTPGQHLYPLSWRKDTGPERIVSSTRGQHHWTGPRETEVSLKPRIMQVLRSLKKRGSERAPKSHSVVGSSETSEVKNKIYVAEKSFGARKNLSWMYLQLIISKLRQIPWNGNQSFRFHHSENKGLTVTGGYATVQAAGEMSEKSPLQAYDLH